MASWVAVGKGGGAAARRCRRAGGTPLGVGGEHLGVDVHRHQVAVAAVAAAVFGGQERLGHGHQGVGAAASGGASLPGRFRGNVILCFHSSFEGLSHRRSLSGVSRRASWLRLTWTSSSSRCALR
ncbi:MAG: hypothetical protein M3N00_02640 [Actinomycetota bacterium]|nr:hypothetical protein [Actinomycetota bacterium]